MRLDRKLNLIIPIVRDDKSNIFVHSTPLSSEVFDTYFLVIAKTFSAIYAEGLGIIAGPRVADKMLRKVAKDMGVWDTKGGVQDGLIAEMHRLTNVVCAGKRGWEALPFADAQTQ